jgi:endothelin-converting enzyme/putative endopeptidase
MRHEIAGLDWMGSATKRQALEKLALVTNKIGYPDRWRDYSALEIHPDDLADNVRRANRFEFQRVLAKIGKPYDRSEWQMTPQTVNAYYSGQTNDINFPAGVLQPPLYDRLLDDAPNYGNTGGTIGHELTHGFDDQGRKFDGHGTLRDWWSKQDAEHFTERAQCIIDQYASYIVIDDIHINSKLTLGEDIADLGGLILARMAWKVETAHKKTRNGRWLHARPALLHRKCPMGLREHPPGTGSAQCRHRSPFARPLPGQWAGGQYAAIRRSIFLQTRSADGEQQDLQDLVI